VRELSRGVHVVASNYENAKENKEDKERRDVIMRPPENADLRVRRDIVMGE